MPIADLFSKRQRELRGELPDVYAYDDIPQKLRVQVVHILHEAFGTYETRHFDGNSAENLYKFVNKTISKEYGVFSIGTANDINETAVTNFILKESDFEKVLDVIELTFRVIDRVIREDQNYIRYNKLTLSADDAISELNGRFKENGIGYEYLSGKIIRIDNQITHENAIKPALYLISESLFAGANQEFLKAYDEYKSGNFKNSLVEALKSFESVLKTICSKRGWEFDSRDTASRLVKIVIEKGLLPKWQEENLTGIRLTLESIATPRNKMGGHGQGTTVVSAPEFYARYALNITASAIVRLIEADAALT